MQQNEIQFATSDKEVLFTRVLSDFTACQFQWALLNSADKEPKDIENDLDILVDPRAVSTAVSVVTRCALETNWKLFRIVRKHGLRHILFQHRVIRGCFVNVDVWTVLHYRGLRYIDVSAALSNSITVHRGCRSVSPGVEAAYGLTKELLANGKIRDGKRQRLQRCITVEPDDFSRALTPRLRADTIALLKNCLLGSDWEGLHALRARLLADLLRSSAMRPVPLIRYLCSTFTYYMRADSGLFIVLLGPDGSGKTTIAEALCRRFHNSPFKTVRHMAMNFGILPQLGILFGRRSPSTSSHVETASTPGKPHSRYRAVVYLVWYGLDALLGRVWIQRAKGLNHFVVFARYYYDYYFQVGQRRTPKWIIDCGSAMAPRPDFVFYLKRQPAAIFADKPELSVEEIARQQDLIAERLLAHHRCIEIDTSHSIADTVDQIEELILERLSAC